MLGALVLALVTLVLAVPMASAQDLDDIVSELERSGYYIEPGADATESEMRSLVDRGNNTAVAWYYVVLSGPAGGLRCNHPRCGASNRQCAVALG